jgi:hypothetical protein
MLKIKNIKFGLIPTGPAIGTPSIQVFFDENEDVYELDDYDRGLKWEFNQESRIVMESPRELFLEFVEAIKQKKLEKEYCRAADSHHCCFLVYMGGVIDNPKNFIEFNRFQVDLSNSAWNYQISIGIKVDKMRAPFSIFVGVPTYMTGKNQFYQLYNTAYPVLHYKDNESPIFNALALQECLNGQSTILTIFYENGHQDLINNLVSKYRVPGHKVILVDLKSTQEFSPADIARKNFYRYSPYLKGKNFLKLI